MSRFIYFTVFACITILTSSLALAQVDLKKKNPELGLNPPLPPGLTKATTSSFTNIRVLPSSSHQSETSISIHPTNSSRLLGGANTDAGQGYYYSTNGGSAWNGSDHLLQTSANATDPAVAFERNGNAYFNYIDGNLLVAKSTDGGITWQNPVTISTSTNNPDKNYIAIDTNPNSSYQNYIYVIWTDFPGSNPIRFSRSTNGGQSFSGNLNISGGTTVVQGAVPAVGPNGNVYVAWGIGNPNQSGIGFNKSTDGGASFASSSTITSVTQIGTLSNSRYRLKPSGIRVNSFPSIAVDRSGGINNGAIYVVWSDQRSASPGSGTPDILLMKSTDGGTTWSSSPVRVNSTSTGDQWFPWIDVAPDGAIYVVFYDSRNDTSNVLTEVYVARSIDGGESFANYKVSDTTFAPHPIPGYASGYMGDYIGITSSAGKAHPFWMDNRTNGIYQAYTAVLNFPTAPSSVTAFPASSSGNSVRLTWTNPSFAGFAGVLIWRKTGSSFTQAPTQGSPPSQTPPAGISNVWYGNNTQYLNTGLSSGTTYYYKLFAYDNNYNYSVGAQITATPHKTTSTSTFATAYNNQRKIVYDGTNYHMAYESGGEIYYTYSNDNGSTWSNELLISDGNGSNKCPSIVFNSGRLYVVWQRNTSGNNYTIYFRTNPGSGWGSTLSLGTVSFSSPNNPLPLLTVKEVRVSGGTRKIRLVACWKSSSAITYRYSDNDGGTWATAASLPSTTSSHQSPSLSPGALFDYSYLDIYVTYDNPTYAVYLNKYHTDLTSNTTSWGSPEVVPASSATGPRFSQVTSGDYPEPSPNVYVVWQGFDPVEQMGAVYYQGKVSGAWTTSNAYVNYSYQRPTITNLSSGNLAMLWDNGSNVYKATYSGNPKSWSSSQLVASGFNVNPSISFGIANPPSSAKYIWTSGTAAPYQLQVSSETLQKPAVLQSEYHRRITVADSVGAVFLVDLGEFHVETTGGLASSLEFVNVNDTLISLTDENLWTALQTKPI